MDSILLVDNLCAGVIRNPAELLCPLLSTVRPPEHEDSGLKSNQ
jgi:hypothetical protein